MALERNYTTRRMAIATRIAKIFAEQLDGTGASRINIFGNTEPRLRFWDDIDDFPYVSVSAGPEYRDYQGGGYKDRYLTVTVKAYVNQEDSLEALEALLEDIETVIEGNGQLKYQDSNGKTDCTRDITVQSITTDEGVLTPIGAGEIILLVHY